MTPSAIQAAIDAGTAKAFERFGILEADALSDLVALYERAAADIDLMIARLATPDGNIDLSTLQVLAAQIRQRIDELTIETASTITTTIRATSPIGAAAMTGVVGAETITAAATDASEFVLKLYRFGGLGLSERVWQMHTQATDAISRAIQSSIVRGEGAYEAAWQMVAGSAKNALLADPNNPLFKAARVMRTEMARAHNAAYINATRGIDGLIGYRFNLSPLHRVIDQCDTLAKADQYGLGAGVFPVANTPRMPVHPHGRSYLTAVIS